MEKREERKGNLVGERKNYVAEFVIEKHIFEITFECIWAFCVGS